MEAIVYLVDTLNPKPAPMNTEHEITICLGSSCFSRGNKITLEAIKAYIREHSLEGRVFFHGDMCNDLCDQGPILKIDDQVFRNVNSDNVYEILNQFFETIVR